MSKNQLEDFVESLNRLHHAETVVLEEADENKYERMLLAGLKFNVGTRYDGPPRMKKFLFKRNISYAARLLNKELSDEPQWFWLEEAGFYKDGSKAIRVKDNNGHACATLTVFIADHGLAKEMVDHDFFLIKNWTENKALFEALMEQKVLVPSGVEVPSGFIRAPICSVNWD